MMLKKFFLLNKLFLKILSRKIFIFVKKYTFLVVLFGLVFLSVVYAFISIYEPYANQFIMTSYNDNNSFFLILKSFNFTVSIIGALLFLLSRSFINKENLFYRIILNFKLPTLVKRWTISSINLLPIVVVAFMFSILILFPLITSNVLSLSFKFVYMMNILFQIIYFTLILDSLCNISDCLLNTLKIPFTNTITNIVIFGMLGFHIYLVFQDISKIDLHLYYPQISIAWFVRLVLDGFNVSFDFDMTIFITLNTLFVLVIIFSKYLPYKNKATKRFASLKNLSFKMGCFALISKNIKELFRDPRCLIPYATVLFLCIIARIFCVDLNRWHALIFLIPFVSSGISLYIFSNFYNISHLVRLQIYAPIKIFLIHIIPAFILSVLLFIFMLLVAGFDITSIDLYWLIGVFIFEFFFACSLGILFPLNKNAKVSTEFIIAFIFILLVPFALVLIQAFSILKVDLIILAHCLYVLGLLLVFISYILSKVRLLKRKNL